MLHNDVYFHNVSELEQLSYLPGLRLQRFPKQVRHSLTEKGKTKAVQSNGCELRFVTEAKYVQVVLASQDTNGKVLVFKGDFFHSSHELEAGVMTTIPLEEPERFAQVIPEKLNNRAFSANVWRIFCERFNAVFYHIDAFGFPVRPPYPQEMPQLTLLAYGSSITQGAGALSHYNGYIQQAARRLEIDALNLGLSGSCFCEEELSDHIAQRNDWDMVYLEIGVNMRAVVPPEEFQRRASYLLDRIIEQHPQKPVFLTYIYPNRATYFTDYSHAYSEAERRYNEILRQYAAAKNHSFLYVLDGNEIMDDFTSLTSDLIHPSDYGHIRMGEKLADFMLPAVNQLRESHVRDAIISK
ncbi:SGNH/GDSL hydrolase family protein [Paenibacillus alba]|uniref:SGNH/GDSL hydrolase family protein n=1 Tax=Paenibacillus alba TaxID=1197127 RepID=A0ABU6FVX2_9BACL|nr:GDSL-type esterase/lipase family protein [Paenibacillus alba]MEC0225885.1 SGNH/GDSL hydrolase family protein [Paenibacillus alba]